MKKIIIKILLWLLIFSQIWNITTYANNSCKVVEWKKYNHIYNLNWIKYSPDWKSYAFVAEKDWKYILVKDGVESKKYDDVWNLKYSIDWKKFTFLEKKMENGW